MSTLCSAVRNGVLTLTGYGIDLRVNRGHLVLTDGVADERRQVRLPRVSPDLTRVVVFGHAGTVTLQAVRWIRDRDAAFVQIDHDGEVLMTSEPEGRARSELLRAQVLASEGEAAMEVARQLVIHKIQGQIEVLEGIEGGAERRPTLERELVACRSAETGKELAGHESQAALAYWDAWVPLPIRFEDPDAVPDHWQTAGGRRSPLMEAGNRKAVTPTHAMLNYLYAVLQAEARLTALQFGFDPGIGIFHATYQGRDSFSLDLMEPVRPLVDRLVLELLQDRTFTKEDFFETREGVCRILPPVARQLSETAILWRKPLRDLAEAVAETLLRAGDRGSRGLLSLTEGHTEDGRQLAAPLRKFRWSPDSWAETRWKTQLRDRHKENRAWQREAGELATGIDYESDIAPALAGMAIREIAEVTGLSETYAAEIRRGEKVPHRRHWERLAELAESRREEAEHRRELEQRFAEVDFGQDIRPGLEAYTLREISEATGLSEGYLGEIRRGEKVPSLEHWPAFDELAEAI